MKQFAKKFTAAVLAAVMAGTAPGTAVFADSIESGLLTDADADVTQSENTSDSLITDNNAVSADSSVITDSSAISASSSSESVSSDSSDVTENKAYEVSASGFVDDKYEMTAEEITDEDVLTEIKKLMEGREILAPVEISVAEGTVFDVEKGIAVTLHGLDFADTDDVGLYHIEDFDTDSPQVEKLDYKAEEESPAANNGTSSKTITFTTRSFSPFIFARMTDAEIAAEKEKKEETQNDKPTEITQTEETQTEVTQTEKSASAEEEKNTANTPSAAETENSVEDTEKQEVKASSVTPSPEAPEEEPDDKNQAASSANAEPRKAKILAKAAANTLNINDVSLTASITSGADTDTYVWTPQYDESDHAYIYRVNYTSDGTGGYAPGQFCITVPGHLLKDRDGNFADRCEMSVPIDTTENLTDANPLVYKEEGDKIVVYNQIEIPAEQKGYVEVAYNTTKKTWDYADYAKDGNGANGKNRAIATLAAHEYFAFGCGSLFA